MNKRTNCGLNEHFTVFYISLRIIKSPAFGDAVKLIETLNTLV
jgi:hypothetical protein